MLPEIKNEKMKKTINSISKMLMITMLVFVACTSFYSCGKDSNNSAIDEGSDDEDPVSLVGTWKITSNEHYEIENGKKSGHYIDDWVDANYIFYADGNGFLDDEGHFSWKRSGNSLTIIDEHGDEYIYKIKSLTSSTLLIECSQIDFYDSVYAKKVK